MKKTLLLILGLGVVLVAAFAFSECSKQKHFENTRTYTFSSATINFYNDYEKSIILDGQTEQDFINSHSGIQQTKFIFYSDGSMYYRMQNIENYSSYYEFKENVINIYDYKGGEKILSLTMSENKINVKLFYFDFVGTGKSYFNATFTMI